MPTHIAAFVAGFATGWVVRSSVDSTRGVAVRLVASVVGTVDRAQRLVAIEKEYFEDLMAEGRSRYEATKARAKARREAKVKLVKNDEQRTAS